MLKIIIADDHMLIREGIRKIIKKESDMIVVGEAEDSINLMRMIKEIECDLLILDLNMPEKNGLDLLPDIKESKPGLVILILSMYPEDSFAYRTFKSGASGYISKGSSAEELIKAIRMVSAGRKYVSQDFAETIVENINQSDQKPLHENLSNREFQIFCLLGKGRTTAKIANELCISTSTVNTYRQRIMDKMNMNSVGELIRYALKNNLIE
jgi:DNA-binding NarL/FixJ family response regulator